MNIRKLAPFLVIPALALLSTARAQAENPLKATAFAILLDPNTHAYVATLVEDCARGKARVATSMGSPRVLEGTEYLGIAREGTQTLSSDIEARGGSISLAMFGGVSKIGCLAEGSSVALVYSPGGMLRNMLIVLGQGIVTAVK